MLKAIAYDWTHPGTGKVYRQLKQTIWNTDNEEEMENMKYWLNHYGKGICGGCDYANFRVVEVKFIEGGEGE